MYSIYCKLRDEKKLKDSDISKATGITKSTFSDWKSGRSKPKQDKLQKIADYFGVSLEYLTTGKEKDWQPTITEKEERDISKKAANFIESLGNDSGLMFNGEPIDNETRALFQNALEVAMKTASLTAKQKFTPNKYKK